VGVNAQRVNNDKIQYSRGKEQNLNLW